MLFAMRATVFCLWLAIAFSQFAYGQSTLTGRVVKVSDGDTIHVQTAIGEEPVKIRLAGIDAPENRQPFSEQSRRGLAEIVAGKTVTVEWFKKDKYQRLVGKVKFQDLDAGLAQVRAGLAWHYKQFANEQSAADQIAYDAAEVAARARRIGLWKELRPDPPWEWRDARRKERGSK
jgi:endonuclease YncB( thermonuclease family)